MNQIATNAVTLVDAQERIGDWRTRIQDVFGTNYLDTPVSILIPLSDLTQIVSGFSNLPEPYEVTAARLYLTFSPGDGPNCIAGLLVPVGNRPGILTAEDIVVDVSTGMPIGNGPVDPATVVSVYDFTHPCPPIGHCEGVSGRLNGG